MKRQIDPATSLMFVLVAGMILLALVTAPCGCASAARTGSVTADDVRQAVQSGVAPIAASIESVKLDASGIRIGDIIGTGAGAAGLTMAALYAWLSHRREMVRLRRNGANH